MKNKLSIVGIVLIVCGLAVMAYAFLPHYFSGLNMEAGQKQTASELEKSWSSKANVVNDKAGDRPSSKNTAVKSEDVSNLPEGSVFGVMKVPTFGADWKAPIAHGTTKDILDNVGVGHYPNTEGPGQTGNFVLAGHNSYGSYGIFYKVHELKTGDEIFIETEKNRYVYKFRSSEIVEPDQREVLYPVPHKKDAKATESLLTLTTCWPAWSDEQRLISYAVLDRVEPR